MRDALLGVPAHDLDVATDATPDQIELLFEQTVGVGKSFGVMRVLVAGADIEVASFRTDGTYQDGRRPEGVSFSSPEEDALRRDFTVNALFFDLKNRQVLDFVEGEKDLRSQLLRAVGEPSRRFSEDHLRLLRAARFVGQLNFVLEPKTALAVKACAAQVQTVSGERIRDEIGKLLKVSSAQKGLQTMVDTGLMKHLFPFRQEDAFWPALLIEKLSVSYLWQSLALFLGSASSADRQWALKVLRLSVKEHKNIERVLNLWQKPQEFFKKTHAQQLIALSEGSVLWGLQVVAAADTELAFGNAPYAEFKSQADLLLQDWQRREASLPEAFLNGDDVKAFVTGPAIGSALNLAYEKQIDGSLKDREAALSWLQETYNKCRK